MDAALVQQCLATIPYAKDVKLEIREATQIGVRGVPHFALSSKYAVSGAQQSETFLNALQQTWCEIKPETDSPADDAYPVNGCV